MNNSYALQYIYLGVLTLVFGGLTVAILMPFLGPILFAAVTAVMLEPIYRYIKENIPADENVAAGGVVIVTLLFILFPLGVIGTQLFIESQQLYEAYQAGNTPNLMEIVDRAEAFVQGYVPQFSLDISAYIGTFLDWLTRNLGTILSGTVSIILDTILFVFALFFFVRDGDVFARWYRRMSPLKDDRDQELLDTLKTTVNSVIRGTIFIGIIQGVVAAIGFAIFGVPNVVLWGAIAAVSAVIPGLGVGLVFIPMVGYLLIAGQIPTALGIAVWGSVIVGLVDNALVPYFYSRGLSLHPMFILLAVLGGVSLIGAFGFIFGPLVFSVVVSLAQTYMKTHDEAGHPQMRD